MPELIDRAKVLEYLTPRIKTKTPYGEGYNRALEDAAELVNLMPTIEAEPVRHGRWMKIEPTIRLQSRWKCSRSKCGGIVHAITDYCPYCGARMDLRTPTEVQIEDADSVMMGGADNG